MPTFVNRGPIDLHLKTGQDVAVGAEVELSPEEARVVGDHPRLELVKSKKPAASGDSEEKD